MYGMIHKAAKDFTLLQVGEATWQEIVLRCGLNEEHFISGKHYDDETTLALIGEISSTLDTEIDVLLFEFGQFWIKFTARSSYGNVLDMAGDNLASFVGNLDDMHRSITATMPEARMPSFFVQDQSETEISLLYRSDRSGLTEFVRGLLTGLMDRFGETGEISSFPQGSDIIFTISRLKESRAA